MNPARTLAVLRHRPLRPFLWNRFFVSLATTMLRATVLWQVWARTESALLLGAVGLMSLPSLPLSLWGGSLADRSDRRSLAWRACLGLLAVCGLLAAGTLAGLGGIAWILGLVAAGAVAHAFENPARQAVLPLLVPRTDFGAAVVVQSTVQNLAWLTGPMAAGFVIAASSVGVSYCLCAASVALSLFGLKALPRTRLDRPPVTTHLESIREGFTFVRGQPALLWSMILDLFAVVFASVTALLPLYAEEILGMGPRGYGLLSSALELGTVLMALFLLGRAPIRRPGRALLWAVMVFGLATVAFGVSRSFALSYACLVVAGMADQISMVTRGMLLHLETPDALRGRVSSIHHVFVTSSNHIGTVESGVLAWATSGPFAVIAGGLLCLGVVGWVAWRVPALRERSAEA